MYTQYTYMKIYIYLYELLYMYIYITHTKGPCIYSKTCLGASQTFHCFYGEFSHALKID